MTITSAVFVKGAIENDPMLRDRRAQVAIIGRSNVGKSSTINIVTGVKGLARVSSFPGRTQELNIFLINNSWYLVDLPGYGFAKASKETRAKLHDRVNWYLFESEIAHKHVVLIIDAFIGPTDNDIEMYRMLREHGKDVIVVANKIDKIKKSAYEAQIKTIRDIFEGSLVIPFSAEEKIGVGVLTQAMLH